MLLKNKSLITNFVIKENNSLITNCDKVAKELKNFFANVG